MSPTATNDLEELLKLATDSNKTESISTKANELEEFFLTFKLEKGNQYIKRSTLYYVYSRWSKASVSEKAFYEFFSKLLHEVNRSNQLWYKLNKTSSDLIKNLHSSLVSKDISELPQQPRHKYHMDKFLAHYEIKRGKAYAPGYALYYLYDLWTNGSNLKALKEQRFKQYCALYFHEKNLEDGLAYGINVEAFNKYLPQNILEDLRVGQESKNKKK